MFFTVWFLKFRELNFNFFYMMKNITLSLLLFGLQSVFAQFSPQDVKYFSGTGAKTAYLVVDFNDENTPNSYVWGYRFDDANLTMEDLINGIALGDPTLQVQVPSGFLYAISYNHHNPSTDDYWSTWSGTSSDKMTANKGANLDTLADGRWYGASYGYGFTPDTSLSHPSEPVAAYGQQWYRASNITTWLGSGTKRSLVIVDFGTETNTVADSYVFGIRHDGAITSEEALDLIATELTGFDYVLNASDLSSVTIGSRTETAISSNEWKVYKGTNLSNWKAQDDFSQVSLDHNDWLGLSIGIRRPFTPQEITASLSTRNFKDVRFSLYPNPARDWVSIKTDETIKDVTVYNMQGRKMLRSKATFSLNVSSLNPGIYLLEVRTDKGASAIKLIKK